jgi:transposase, IS5 family
VPHPDSAHTSLHDPVTRANQIRSQQQRQRGWKLYSFHAPEVECIGKGKASAPYEFGVKASIDQRPRPRGQFVLHAKALPGNPYDGHTLGAVIEATEGLTGCEIERAYVDKGYRAHDTTIRAASSSLARSAARTAAYGSHPSSHVFSAASCPPMRQQRESQK